ncbi:hypothetical protein PAXINDRAFT_20436 [Paxillus involutus ATCC 200175]|uniref:Transmembrane protein n=1 Tax=Paxillus involutus ATCC 200175 TaxID=664439 RepID=A0A0C9SML2_PAXIN|nr:hypothetical protein PAXINDRAFT_20436 [Paxillus involutus ATCC 200175]
MPKKLCWSSLAILATSLLSTGPPRVAAQTSNVVCLSLFNWMVNSKGQNPCLVTAYLAGACNGGQFEVYALPPNSAYLGPTAAGQNPCQCSTVTYATLSACALCQNQTYIAWSSWDLNCTTFYPSVFPVDIPNGTAIPAWAYQDVVTSDLFNVTLAETTGDNPESTATHVQSTGSAVTSTSAVSASLTGSPSVTVTPTSTSSSSSSSNTGAIAGGVVGGVVALAAIVGVISYLALKKKRSRVAPSAQFADPAAAASYNQSMHTNPFTPPSTETQQRLYDPSDPSTFPTSLFSPTILTTPSHNYQSSLSYPGQTGRPGGYSGAPEV